ncbi:MAG TPA: LPXTG cell wall anchor domain-containing protein [Tepidiformaceae bacterium]|nr:LPXTG cell wall anchor domain-containing protein [Tepidiformaceae bacterium]
MGTGPTTSAPGSAASGEAEGFDTSLLIILGAFAAALGGLGLVAVARRKKESQSS